jgi:PAS domain S-box-containing protein
MADDMQGVDPWLVDSLVVPASLHDVEGRFVRLNAAAERAIGSSNAHWLGRHFSEPLPPEARENVEAQFRRAVDTGEPTDFETVFTDASGTIRGCELSTCLSDAATRSWAFSFSPSTCVNRRRASSCIRD